MEFVAKHFKGFVSEGNQKLVAPNEAVVACSLKISVKGWAKFQKARVSKFGLRIKPENKTSYRDLKQRARRDKDFKAWLPTGYLWNKSLKKFVMHGTWHDSKHIHEWEGKQKVSKADASYKAYRLRKIKEAVALSTAKAKCN